MKQLQFLEDKELLGGISIKDKERKRGIVADLEKIRNFLKVEIPSSLVEGR